MGVSSAGIDDTVLSSSGRPGLLGRLERVSRRIGESLPGNLGSLRVPDTGVLNATDLDADEFRDIELQRREIERRARARDLCERAPVPIPDGIKPTLDADEVRETINASVEVLTEIGGATRQEVLSDALLAATQRSLERAHPDGELDPGEVATALARQRGAITPVVDYGVGVVDESKLTDQSQSTDEERHVADLADRVDRTERSGNDRGRGR
jgi:hypothetical protein